MRPVRRDAPLVTVRAVVVPVLVALALFGLIPSTQASPGDVTAVGWWTRNPGQTAPAGGMAVAAAPDGAVTTSAVAFDAGDGLLSATLTAVETGGVATSAAGLQVCASDPGWTPAEGGALADAPEGSCEQASVPFERDADAQTWSADVTSLVAGTSGVVSLVLVPADDAALAAFDVRLAAPVVDAQPIPEPAQVPFEPDSSSSGSGGGDGGTPAGGGFSTPDFDTGFSPQPQATPSFEPEAPAEPSTSVPAETDAGEGGDDLAADDEIAIPPLVPTASGGEPDHRTVGKAVTYVLLSALAGVVVGGGSRIVRLRSVA